MKYPRSSPFICHINWSRTMVPYGWNILMRWYLDTSTNRWMELNGEGENIKLHKKRKEKKVLCHSFIQVAHEKGFQALFRRHVILRLAWRWCRDRPRWTSSCGRRIQTTHCYYSVATWGNEEEKRTHQPQRIRGSGLLCRFFCNFSDGRCRLAVSTFYEAGSRAGCCYSISFQLVCLSFCLIVLRPLLHWKLKRCLWDA